MSLHTLDNGLRVVFSPVPHARSVSVSVYLTTGARNEQPHEAGIAHFVEHLCFKGTQRRPRPQDVAIEVDALGGGANAATDREFTVYYARVTPEHVERAVDLLADMVRNSLFRTEEIERERGVILEELAAVEDAPDEHVGIVLDGLLWPEQAHGRDVGGTAETVRAIAPERLIEFYRQQYVADAAVVSIAGALDEDAVMPLVRAAFGDWEPGAAVGWARSQDEPRGARVRTIAKQTEQAHVAFGFRALSAVDEDRYALELLSTVLGEGMSSRLFTRLREELGLCYDIHSFAGHLRDAGSFGVYTGVDPVNASEAVAEVIAELRRLRQAVSADELARAQEMVRTRLQLRMEDTRAVSGWFGVRETLDLPHETPEQARDRSSAVTVDDLARVAQRVLVDDELHLAVIGPVDGAALIEGRTLDD